MQRVTSTKRQRGVVFLATFLVLMTAALYLLTAHMARASARSPQANPVATRTALGEAKAALIAFASLNRNRPGGLPCPDRDGDGEAELQCDHPADRVGFLPWQTLATDDLRDASGARLWYVVASTYRNDANIIINAATRGDLAIRAEGVAGARHDDLVAAVIAPGIALTTQSRAGSHRAADFIESVAGPAFNEIDRSNSNDVVEPVTANELWASAERVVAERIAREIAPVVETEYVAKWRRMPFAAPFIEPGQARAETALTQPRDEGLMPASEEANAVEWERTATSVTAVSGAGQLLGTTCQRSLTSEIRCDISYVAPLRVRVDGVALHVGHAFVAPPTNAPADFGPAGLGMPSIEVGAPRADGRAAVTAYATLPEHSNAIRLTLQAPKPLRTLVDRRIPVAEPHSWFARNEWFRFVTIALSPSLQPGPSRPPCTATADCIMIDHAQRHHEAPAALVFTGRGRTDPNASAVERYFEGANAHFGDRRLDARAALPQRPANDRVMPLCATTAACEVRS